MSRGRPKTGPAFSVTYERKNVRLSPQVKAWLLINPRGARTWLEDKIKKAVWEQTHGIFRKPRPFEDQPDSVIFSIRLHPDLMNWLRAVGAREFIEDRAMEDMTQEALNKLKSKE